MCQSELWGNVFKTLWQLQLCWFVMEGWSKQVVHLSSGSILQPSLGVQVLGFCFLNTSVIFLCRLFQWLSSLEIRFSIRKSFLQIWPKSVCLVPSRYRKSDYFLLYSKLSHSGGLQKTVYSQSLQSFVPNCVFYDSVTVCWTSSRFPHLSYNVVPLAKQRNPMEASPVLGRADASVPSVLSFPLHRPLPPMQAASDLIFAPSLLLTRQGLWNAKIIQFVALPHTVSYTETSVWERSLSC